MTQTAFHGAPAATAKAVCIFTHGRGQTPEQMIGAVLARVAAPGVRFVLPRAPGGSWYDAKAVDPLQPETRAQLETALDQLSQTIAAARAACPGLPLVVAGFSQGACLSTEYLLRGGAADAAVLLTGCRVGAFDEGLPTKPLHGLPVYASNGDADPWVPLPAWHLGVAALAGTGAGTGARLRGDILPGRGHEVSDGECAVLSQMLGNIAAGREPWAMQG